MPQRTTGKNKTHFSRVSAHPLLYQVQSCPLVSKRGIAAPTLNRNKRNSMTERLHFHFSLSRIGEGNGNPLQCSCLKNPRDGGAWWAVVYGVTQSRTRLRRLSSSSLVKKIPQWDGERRVPLSYGTLMILKGMCMWSSLVYTQIHLHAPKRHRIVTQGTLSTKCVP